MQNLQKLHNAVAESNSNPIPHLYPNPYPNLTLTIFHINIPHDTFYHSYNVLM